MYFISNGTIFALLLKHYFYDHYKVSFVVLAGLMSVIIMNAAIYVGILLRKRREQARR